VDELTALHLLGGYFAGKILDNPVVVAADIGAAKRARDFAAKLDASFAIINKRRVGNRGQTEALNIIGDVAGCTAIIMDDEIDTAGSVVAAHGAILEAGARSCYVCATHPVLSGPAVERLRQANFQEIVVTDTIPIPPEKRLPTMTVLSVAPLLGEVIRRIHHGQSVGTIFGE
jgi:ribose-phosphate pyrophosphokinase